MLDTHGRKYIQPLLDALADRAIKHHVKAVPVTLMAFACGMVAVVALGMGYNILAVVLLWVSGLMDALDGTIARKTQTTSPLGTLLDITLDRLVELGLVIAMALRQVDHAVMLVVLTASFVLSMTIFLTVGNFAKNTGQKTFYYQAGLAERTEGFLFFSLMILWGDMAMIIGYIFAALVFITAGKRFYEGIQLLKGEPND